MFFAKWGFKGTFCFTHCVNLLKVYLIEMYLKSWVGDSIIVSTKEWKKGCHSKVMNYGGDYQYRNKWRKPVIDWKSQESVWTGFLFSSWFLGKLFFFLQIHWLFVLFLTEWMWQENQHKKGFNEQSWCWWVMNLQACKGMINNIRLANLYNFC